MRKGLIVLILVLVSSMALSESKKVKYYIEEVVEKDSTDDCFMCDIGEEEKVLKDEHEKITVKKKNEVIIFSIQTKNESTNNITEKIDIRIDERTMDLARKFLKIIKTYQDGQ